jgi:hypothetical protein
VPEFCQLRAYRIVFLFMLRCLVFKSRVNRGILGAAPFGPATFPYFRKSRFDEWMIPREVGFRKSGLKNIQPVEQVSAKGFPKRRALALFNSTWMNARLKDTRYSGK